MLPLIGAYIFSIHFLAVFKRFWDAVSTHDTNALFICHTYTHTFDTVDIKGYCNMKLQANFYPVFLLSTPAIHEYLQLAYHNLAYSYHR